MALEKEAQDLASEMTALRESLQGLGKSAKDKETGLKAFADATAAGAVNVTKSLGAFTLQVGKGDTSFSSLTGVVDTVTNALAGMAKAVPVAGNVMAAGVKAAGEVSKFLLDQLDQTAKGFNAMSEAGALTATGMTGLMDQSLRSGIPLKTFTKVVAENSQALAGWTGVTGTGAEEFSKIVGSFTQGQGDSLRRLGQNAEQIAETTGAYLTQQVRLGTAQNKSTAELITGTKTYALELDELQKITGMSAKNIQKQQDEMMSYSRFRANIQQMVDNGQEGLAKVLQDTQTQMANYGPTIGKGFADLTSGVASTVEAQKLLSSTGGAAMDIIDRLKTGKINQAQANDEMLSAMEKQVEWQQTNAKFVDAATSGQIPLAELRDAIATKRKGAAEKAKTTQTKQLSGQDKLTADVVTAQKELEKFSLQIQEMSRDYMPLAADATKMLADSIKKFIEYSSSVLGESKEGKPVSGLTGAAAGAGSLGLAGATLGAIAGPAGIAAGGAIGAAIGGVAGYFGMIDYGITGPDKKGTGSTAPTDTDASGTESAFTGGASLPVGPEQGNAQDNVAKIKAGQATVDSVGAARGAILSGPTSGYQPGASMSGIESRPLTAANLNNATGTSVNISEIMSKQLIQLDALISSARTQLSVKEKILMYKA
jgi:hypothetical protein